MIDETWLRARYEQDRAPIAAIAAEAGVDPSTIHRALRAAGVAKRGKTGARAVHTLDREWVVTRRGEGASWGAIAREAGIDRSSVLWQAAGYGLYDLGGGDEALYRRAVCAAEKYRSGQSLVQVAAAIGVDRRTVTRWLRALGVEIRSQGHPRSR